MSAYAATDTLPRPGWISRSVNWLDERGPISWIALMVGSFIFAGPLGLLVLGFILVTGRFGRRFRPSAFSPRRACGMHIHARRSTGNSAFDSYKADTLARLEREQDAFEAFLARLRASRDKAEFDQYMDERADAAQAPAPQNGEQAPQGGPTPGQY